MNLKVILFGAVVTVPTVAVLAMSFGRDPHAIRTPMVGRAAPALTLRDVVTNESVSLKSFRGKPVVVNFWASWCEPCLQEHATLVSAARSLGSEVQFIGIVYEDTQDRTRDFLRRHGSAYPSLLDEDGQAAIAFGVYGVPETFFVNPAGSIASKHTGPLTSELLSRNIQGASR